MLASAVSSSGDSLGVTSINLLKAFDIICRQLLMGQMDNKRYSPTLILTAVNSSLNAQGLIIIQDCKDNPLQIYLS